MIQIIKLIALPITYQFSLLLLQNWEVIFMRLTTKGRYVVTAILDVALYECNGPVSVSDVAERQGLSPSYLEKLFSNLKKKRTRVR